MLAYNGNTCLHVSPIHACMYFTLQPHCHSEGYASHGERGGVKEPVSCRSAPLGSEELHRRYVEQANQEAQQRTKEIDVGELLLHDREQQPLQTEQIE